MKLSIVTAILNSHEVVRRQIIHYNKIGLPENVEVIFVDDGSDPPLFGNPVDNNAISHWEKWCGVKLNFCLKTMATFDFRQWTQPAARNLGAKHALGEFLLCTDIDHIVTKEAIEFALNNVEFNVFNVIRFKRQAAVLDENGDFTQDRDVLKQYGYVRERLKLPPHGNSYIIRRGLYLGLGGVSEEHVGTGKYPNREEVPLKRKLRRLEQEGRIAICEDDRRPMIYMIPNGKYCVGADKNYNPFGLFHNLSRSIRESRKRQREYARSISHNPGAE